MLDYSQFRLTILSSTPITWGTRFHVQLAQRGVAGSMTTDYSQGSAISGTPEVKDVLLCLYADSEAGSLPWDEFCNEYGYDSDSLAALDIYRACLKIKHDLRKILKAGQYQELATDYQEW